MITGDFNAVLDQRDKIGGKPVASSSRDGFRNVINENGLIDLGFSGYAWTNRRAGKDIIQERLDRGFANTNWKLLFPSTSISHLTALHSNHQPILINTNPPTISRPKPFRFEDMWIRVSSIGSVVQEAWNKTNPHVTVSLLMSKIKNTKLALKQWNRIHFGNLQSSIKNLISFIDFIQSKPQTYIYSVGTVNPT